MGIPTETVYGLAGRAVSAKALKKIFSIKKRPLFNPLIVHCANAQQMRAFHTITHPLLNKMIHHFCPGPLTFVLDKSPKAHPLAAAEPKIGLRIPNHPLTLKLLKKTGALCAPSANLYKTLSPTQAEDVLKIFNHRVPVLNGGPCRLGIESTVIEPDFKKSCLTILRPGLITQERLQLWLKAQNLQGWQVKAASSRLSPGQGAVHYRPSQPLVIVECLNAKAPFKANVTAELKKRLTLKLQKLLKPPVKPSLIKLKPSTILFKELKLKKSAVITARGLYHHLRELSKNPACVIYVCKIKQHSGGAWEAVWNRLRKASSFNLALK